MKISLGSHRNKTVINLNLIDAKYYNLSIQHFRLHFSFQNRYSKSEY